MAEKNYVKVGGQLQNIVGDGILAYSKEIKDEDRNKTQDQINTETYERVTEINEALGSLSPEQGEALALSERVGQLEKEVGYYECPTAGGTATKQVTADGYSLSSGCSIKVKMLNKNTAASNVMLKIGSSEAKPLYYAGMLASASNTWDAGEVLDVYYNPNDGGAYYANNVEGGSADGVFDISDYNKSGDPLAPTPYNNLTEALGNNGSNVPANVRKGGMSVRFINSTGKYEQWRYMGTDITTTATFTNVANWQGIDATPTAGSENLITSGGVEALVDTNNQKFGLIVDGITYYNDNVILSDTSCLKVGQTVYYKITPSANGGAGIRLWNGSTQIATYGKSSGATADVAIEGSFVVPQNLTKITAVWVNNPNYFTLAMKTDEYNDILREDINSCSSELLEVSNVFEEDITVTTNTTYATSYKPVVGEKVYITVQNPNSVVTNQVNLKFLNGSTALISEDIYVDRQYIYTIPASCNGVSIQISSTQFSQSGTIHIVIESGVAQDNKERLDVIQEQVNDTYFGNLFVNGNLINKDKCIDGYILNSSGVQSLTSTSSTNSITDFIEVLPNSYIASIGTGVSVCQYASDKSYISNSKATITTPTQINSNTKYVRCSFATSDKALALLINKQSYLAAYEFYKGEFNGTVGESAKINSELDKYEAFGKNLFDKTDVIMNRIYNGDTVELSTNGRISKKIPVIPGHRYYISKVAKIFNKKDEIIGTTKPSASFGKFVTMPLNASYIRISCSVNDINNVMACLYDGVSKTEPTYEAFTQMITSPSDKLNYDFIKNLSRDDLNKGFFAGKKLTVDGDSITHDQGQFTYWQYVVKSNLMMDIVSSTFTYDGTDYTIGSKGIAGSRIAVGEENNTKPYCLVLRYQELPDDADLIIIAGGTNDWAHDGVQLGTMSDSTNVTFYGAMHILCKGLIEKYPTKQIVFMTPIKRATAGATNNYGNTLKDFADAILEVCGFYGIPVCDMFRNCCMNPDISVQQQAYFLTGDNTHPNDAGQLKMGNLVSGFVNSLV